MPNVLLVSPKNPVSFWSFDEALKLAGKKNAFPPLGLLTIAGMMPREYQLRVLDMNVRPLRDNDLAWADIVLTSSMIIHWESLVEVIARCNVAGVPILSGGPLPTQYCNDIPGAGGFYLGEAENGFLDVVADMLQPSYQGGRQIIDRRKQFQDLAKTPLPRWDLINMRHYSSMVIQLTRGCPESCTFCNIPALYGKITRVKAQSRIIQELDALYNAHWRGTVMLVDDNFIGNAAAILAALEDEVIPWQQARQYPFSFNTQASIRVSDNPALLAAMHRAGFSTMFAGIESPVEASLKFMGAQKNLQGATPLLEKVRTIQRAGLEVQAGFIMGLDTDPEDIAAIMLAFIRAAGIPVAMVGILGVLPDTSDYKRFEKLGRLVPGVRYAGGSGVFERQLSFIPKMDGNWLLDQHRQLVQKLNSPAIYFERCLTLFAQRPRRPLVRRPVGWSEMRAVLFSFWQQGVAGHYRAEFWKFLYQTARHHGAALPDAIRLAIVGRHFILTTEQALRVDEVKTFLESASVEFEKLASGSRQAFARAEGYASGLMNQVGRRLRTVQQGALALPRMADILLQTAREHCRGIGDGFKHQVSEPLQEFESRIKGILAAKHLAQ